MIKVFRLLAIRRYAGDRSGLASFETALWLAALVPVLCSIVDLGTYAFLRMQVENATQVGAQAAWSNCSSPPITNCATLTTAVDTAIQSTTLGTAVTRSGAVTGQYYCPDINTKILTANGTSTSCSGGRTAGYYAQVSTTYTFRPMFPAASMGALLPAAITKTAWTRLK